MMAFKAEAKWNRGPRLSVLLCISIHLTQSAWAQSPAEDAPRLDFPSTDAESEKEPFAEYIPNEENEYRAMGSMGFEHRRLSYRDYESSDHLTIAAELLGDQQGSIGVQLSAGPLRLKPGGVADQVANDPFLGEIGLAGKFYFSRSHTFLQPYVAAAVSAVWLGWEYRTPVVSRKETVYNDSLGGVDGYGAVGLAVRLHRQVRLFGECGAGAVGLCKADEDGNPLENDTVFQDFGYVGVKAGFTVTF
jgi:hypothetical protein